jgi:hypothetical protein
MSLSREGSIITVLFPKEQVPASTPNPPREVGTISLSSIVAIPWAKSTLPWRLSSAVAFRRRYRGGGTTEGHFCPGQANPDNVLKFLSNI